MKGRREDGMEGVGERATTNFVEEVLSRSNF